MPSIRFYPSPKGLVFAAVSDVRCWNYPPFDPTKFEPMPEIEIDPEDEFHVGNIDNE